MFTQKKYNGAVEIGTIEQKSKLFSVHELVSTPAGVSLADTNPDQWNIYPKRNQLNQSSCTYHARAKAAGILQKMETGEFVDYSATDYNYRSNAPDEGSYPIESFDFWRKRGIGLEALEPSNNVRDAVLKGNQQTLYEKEVAKISMLDAFFTTPARNFDMLISTLHATQKPIPLGFYGTYSEWNQDVPTVQNATLRASEALVRHEVCGTPNIGIYNGKIGFTIEDSWGDRGIADTGVRWITREWFEARNHIAGLVPTRFKTYAELGIDPQKPKSKITRELEKGMTGDDVYRLQMVLKYEDFFPANHTGSTYYGEITERGVKQYQAKHGIIDNGTPDTTGYGRVGPQTKAHINSRYK